MIKIMRGQTFLAKLTSNVGEDFPEKHPMIGKISRKKVADLLGFCPNEGEGGPFPNFLSPFDECNFGQ